MTETSRYIEVYLLLFTLIAFLMYMTIQRLIHYKYYNINHFRRNWLFERLMILLLVVLNVIVGIYIHRLNRPNDGSEMLFFMSAVVNIFYIFLPFNFQYYKEDIIYFKYFVKVHNKIVKKTENDTFWDKFSTLLESLNINEIDYNNKDLSVPLVIFRIKSDNNLWGISIPDYIIKHPLLPEFKRRAKEIEVEEIIQRIGINIYEDGREK